MEHQMEQKVENEMETGVIYGSKGSYVSFNPLP